MLFFSSKTALSLGLLCVITACGDIKGALEFADQRDEFRARRDMLQSRSNSAFTAIPDTDIRTYRGEASLAAGDDSDGIAIVGDAEIIVNFGTGDASGSLDNFGGFDRTREYSDYTGSIELQSARIGVNRPNDIESTLFGTLRGEDYVLSVDAFWEGDFKGTPVVGILGDTRGAQSTFTLNGQVVPGGVVIAVTP